MSKRSIWVISLVVLALPQCWAGLIGMPPL